jgi:hypothetical protein
MSTAEPIVGLHPGDVVTLTITAVFKQLHPGTGRARLVTLERAPQWVEVPYLDNAGQPLAGLSAVKIGVAAQLAITPLPAEVIELSDVTLVSVNTDEYGNVSTTVRDNATGRVITVPGGRWHTVAITPDSPANPDSSGRAQAADGFINWVSTARASRRHILERHERAVQYWQDNHPSLAQGPRDPDGSAALARAAYLSVVRDIPNLLAELDEVTEQRDRAWRELGSRPAEPEPAPEPEREPEDVTRTPEETLAIIAATGTPLTRTPEEILARLAAIGDSSLFGFGVEVLLQALTFEQARPVLKPDATGAEWGEVLDSREKVQDAAVDYLEFAIGKALNHRGLSASRSIDKLTEYLWLLGLDDVLERFEAAGYAQYGMPKLRVMAEQFGMWPYPQLQYSDSTAAALAARAERMAAGQRCTPECQSGCDK